MRVQLEKIKNIIILGSVIILLFGGVNVLNSFGYKIPDGIFKFFPTVYFLIFALLLNLFEKRIYTFDNSKKLVIKYILFLAGLIVYSSMIQNQAVGSIVNTILIPCFFSLLLINNTKIYPSLKLAVKFFFIVNCLVAVLEQILTIHFFSLILDFDIDTRGFRSTALQNHPLTNALITCTISLFIVASNEKLVKKYFYFCLGIIALICYGGRASLIINILFGGYFLLKDFFKIGAVYNTLLSKIIYGVLILAGIAIILYIVNNTSFAERLVNQSHFDDSATVRIQVLGTFAMLDTNDILWGINKNKRDLIEFTLGVRTIENFWILWVLQYGLILTSVKGIFLFKLLWRHIQHQCLTRLLLFAGFMLIASSNNSLSSHTAAVSVFIFCCFVFHSSYQER